MRQPVDARKQRAVDALEENNRQRWLIRNGHRAYGSSPVDRRRAASPSGVHNNETARPSDRRRARGSDNYGGRRSSSPGATLLTLGLFAASVAFGLIGLGWTVVEIARWIGDVVWGGKV